MKTVGVRAFKQRASEILREVREAGVTYDVTYRGEVIASIVPARKQERPMTIDEWDAMMDELAADIEAHTLPEYKGVSAVDMIRYDRDRLDHVLRDRAPRRTNKSKPQSS